MKRQCKQCGKEFNITQSEIDFYKQKNLNLPKRCKECRDKNKMSSDKPAETQSQHIKRPAQNSASLPGNNKANEHKLLWHLAIFAIAIILIFVFSRMLNDNKSLSNNDVQINATNVAGETAFPTEAVVTDDIEEPAVISSADSEAIDVYKDDFVDVDLSDVVLSDADENVSSDVFIDDGVSANNEDIILDDASNDESNSDVQNEVASAANDEQTSTVKEEQVPVAEETAVEAPVAKAYKFRNSKLLNQHYDKHGIEMGFASAAEYEAAASAVVNNPDALTKTEKEDGDFVYYVEATNEFVILSTDGYLRTYFKPGAGKKYYDRQ